MAESAWRQSWKHLLVSDSVSDSDGYLRFLCSSSLFQYHFFFFFFMVIFFVISDPIQAPLPCFGGG